MEERKFIKLKKEEYGIKEYIKRNLGKGKISKLNIEYTPVGEKIIISTNKPQIVIGRRGEKIDELTRVLKTRFKFENPHIEIKEIENPLFDSQTVADDIAMSLERFGNLKFKVIAYRKLQEIMKAGALGCELRLSGKLPSARAKSWRFAEGYLKKAGESRKEVDRAMAIAITKLGVTGIKVAIMGPNARIYDQIPITEEIKAKIKIGLPKPEEPDLQIRKSVKKKKSKEIEKKQNGKQKTKIIENSPELNPEEDGTAMKIEEELEEGVPQDIIDGELLSLEKKTSSDKKETIGDEKQKTKKPKKIKEAGE